MTVDSRIDVCAGGLWHAPQLADGLAELGFDVRVVSTAPIPPGPASRHTLRGVWTLQRAARRLGVPEATACRVLGELLARAVRPDSTVIAWSGWATELLRRGREVTVVRGSHHIATQRQILLDAMAATGLHATLPSEAIVARERAEYRRAKVVSVPTPEIAADPAWTADGASAVANPHGFPTGEATNDDGGRSRTVVFAGEPGLQKGIDRLARALPEPSATVERVRVFGRPQKMRGVLPSWWDAHGQVRHAEVMVAVAEASALVLLSRQEGMARVGQEAMAVGTPIVVSPATGLGAWLTDGGGIVVEDPDDPDAVRAAIGEVMRDWQHHADRAREVARSWTWRDHAQGLLTCLSH